MFLINRLTPMPFESLEGYMDRLGNVNYYDVESWFLPLVPTTSGRKLNMLSHEQSLVSLSQLTLLDVNSLIALTLHRFVPYLYAVDAIPTLPCLSERFPIPLWDLQKRIFLNSIHNQDKICPLCWQEHRTHFLPWQLRPVTTCIVHRTVLTDTCTHCAHTLKVNTKTCPSCENDKDSLPPVYLKDPVEIMYTETIWYSIGFGSNPGDFSVPASNSDGRVELEPPQLFEFLWKMGILLTAYDKENPYCKRTGLQNYNSEHHNFLTVSKAHDVRFIMLSAFQILTDWPRVWHSTLERIAWQENNRKASYPLSSPKLLFPGQLKRIFMEPEWDWLLKAFVRWTEENMASNHLVLPWMFHIIEKPPYKSFTSGSFVKSKVSFCRELGVSQETVNRAIEAGFIRSISTAEATGRQMQRRELLSLEDMEKLQAEKESLISLTQAAEYVGLSSHPQLLLLGKEGILPERKKSVISSKTYPWWYRKDELKTALKNLLDHLPRQPMPPEDPDALSLHQGLHINGSLRMSKLLAAVKDGNLKAFYDPQKQGLMGLWFHRKDIVDFCFACLHPEGYAIYPASRTTRILKCDFKTLRTLFEAQIFIPVIGNLENDELTWKYDSRDVARFQDEYVTSDEAAELAGVSRRVVVSWVVKGWIPAVTGPKVDGFTRRRYRIHKHSLVEWRSKWIDSNEVMQLLGRSRSTLKKWMKEGKLTPIRKVKGHPLWFLQEEVMQLKQEIEIAKKDTSR